MTPDELKVVLDLHLRWLRGEVDGQRANLRKADLSDADLSNADLSYADLSYADLSNADLSDADLSNADLSYADLRDAYLRKANLSKANLSSADLRNANLTKADLGQTHVIQLGPIGSRKEYMIIKWGEYLDEVMTSYFTGTMAEFEVVMEQTYGDNEHGRDYRAIIAMVRTMQGGNRV